jgi:hypothetical protein
MAICAEEMSVLNLDPQFPLKLFIGCVVHYFLERVEIDGSF